MKTISALAFIIAPFALVLFPLSFEVAVSLLVAGGFAAIVLCDYTRTARTLRVPTRVAVTSSRKERFGLAA